MTADRDPILSRIKKLLAMTVEAGATEAEMENALARAAELMERHNVAALDLDHVGGPDAMAGLTLHAQSLGTRKPFEVLAALPVVERVAGVQAIVVERRQAPGGPLIDAQVRLIGTPEAVAVARWLVGHLRTQYLGLWERYRAQADHPLGPGVRQSYLHGLTLGLLCRLDRERAARMLAAPENHNEIALARSRVEAAAEALYPGREVVRRRLGDLEAATDGMRDSDAVSLHRQVAAN